MKIAIDKIIVADRLRKQAVKLDELAQDIQRNGLINPITVMPSGGKYKLLAGFRRLRAAQSLGWTEIDANLVAPKDAEAAIRIEYSENDQREPFTFSEKMDYARIIEAIEQAKAKERMVAGKKASDPVDDRPQGDKSKTRDIVGEKIGMSGRQYDRAKFVANQAQPDMIDALDRGETTISQAYDEIQNTKKPSKNRGSSKPSTSPATVYGSDLERAIHAEQELDAMKYRQHNEIFHRDGIIDMQKRQIDELKKELDTAHKRIHELETKYEA